MIAGRGDVVRTLSIAGETVRREHVHRLAAMLGGDVLGAKFERALDNDNTIVALTSDDRTRLLEVLAPGLPGLGGLRETLLKQRERSKANDQRMARTQRERQHWQLRQTRRDS